MNTIRYGEMMRKKRDREPSSQASDRENRPRIAMTVWYVVCFLNAAIFLRMGIEALFRDTPTDPGISMGSSEFALSAYFTIIGFMFLAISKSPKHSLKISKDGQSGLRKSIFVILCLLFGLIAFITIGSGLKDAVESWSLTIRVQGISLPDPSTGIWLLLLWSGIGLLAVFVIVFILPRREKILGALKWQFIKLLHLLAHAISLLFMKKKRRAFVIESSTAIRELRRLNQEYSKLTDNKATQPIHLNYTLSSKSGFDAFNARKELINEVSLKRESYKQMSNHIVTIRQSSLNYLSDYSKLFSIDSIPRNLPWYIQEKDYKRIEYSQLKANNVCIDIDMDIIISWRYISAKGRNEYHNTSVFHVIDVITALEQARKKDEYENSVARQRSMMTRKIRVRILERDGYRCVLCGRGAKDGVKLEVDHKKPVSKGGLTIESNLQTLCRECNRGKSDEILSDISRE